MSDKKIALAEDTITQLELDALADWIKKGPILTKGPLCLEFEKQFAGWQNSAYSVFVNSGSSANLLIAYALLESGRLKSRKVIAPAVSWVTTVAPFMQFGFDVQLCDCNRENLGLDCDQLERLCASGDIGALILVHVLGHANDMARIQDICRRYDVIIIEDSCEAIGSELDGKKLGSFGIAGSFSFFFGHHISTIEGGMVVTDDRELYNQMLSIRSHGWARDIEPDVRRDLECKYNIDQVRALYTFYYPGFNLRSTDLNAFLGLSQLKKMDAIAKRREVNFNRYAANLSDFWGQKSEMDVLSSFSYGILVKNREEVFRHLTSCRIESRPLICGNIGRHPFWINKYGCAKFPNADIVHEYGLYLPNNFTITDEDIDRVCTELKKVAVPISF